MLDRMATLEAGLDEVRLSPRDQGTLELIVCRPAEEERRLLESAELDLVHGLVGDNWLVRGSRAMPDGSANPLAQLTLMNARSAAVIASERERWPLAGDQLFVDYDLSVTSLPPGSQLRIGSALIEITTEPHRGCGKFSRRFGVEALKFVNSDVGRELNLRGVNARVVEAGAVAVGDAITRA